MNLLSEFHHVVQLWNGPDSSLFLSIANIVIAFPLGKLLNEFHNAFSTLCNHRQSFRIAMLEKRYIGYHCMTSVKCMIT